MLLIGIFQLFYENGCPIWSTVLGPPFLHHLYYILVLNLVGILYVYTDILEFIYLWFYIYTNIIYLFFRCIVNSTHRFIDRLHI